MDNEIIQYLEKKKPMIDSVIKTYFPEDPTNNDIESIFGKPSYEYDLETIKKSLSDPIWDFLNRGGKRWRPTLFLLISEALGSDFEKIKDFVIVPEVAHNGSIVIDDIEDLGEIRRGKPCLHKIFGVDVAINAGNLMYFLPLLAFIKNTEKFDKEIMLRAYEAFSQEMINIHAGQGTDIHWHNGNVENISENQYLQMCAYKTGTLARLSARLAVIFSGGSKEQEKKIGRMTETIGVAFQIQDDILSASGEEFAKKKGYGDDITEGKRTLMVLHALRTNPDKGKRLIEILNMHTKDHDLIKEALEILKSTGSVEYAKEKAKTIMQASWKEVEPLLKESEAKTLLKKFVNFLIERQI